MYARKGPYLTRNRNASWNGLMDSDNPGSQYMSLFVHCITSRRTMSLKFSSRRIAPQQMIHKFAICNVSLSHSELNSHMYTAADCVGSWYNFEVDKVQDY